MKKEYILNINRLNGYCTNISNPKIEPLYNYYRHRIGSFRFPMSDNQRILFDKMIINLCTEGYIFVKHWVLYNYFNVYNRPQWWESVHETVPGKDGQIPYKDIKEELKLICKLMKAQRINFSIELSIPENELYRRIVEIDKRLLIFENNIKTEA